LAIQTKRLLKENPKLPMSAIVRGPTFMKQVNQVQKIIDELEKEEEEEKRKAE